MNTHNTLPQLQASIEEMIHLQQQKIICIQQQAYVKADEIRSLMYPIKSNAQQLLDELLKANWNFEILIDTSLLRPQNSLLIKDVASAQYIIELLGMPQKISCSLHLDNLEEFVQWLIICSLKKDYHLPKLDLIDVTSEHPYQNLMNKFNTRDKWHQSA